MKINFLRELFHTFPRLTVIVSEGLHRQEVFFMKRWRYICAAALIAGSMAAGAGAVSIPSTALTQLQQQWQADTSADYLSADSGQSRIAAYALVPKKSVQDFCRQLVRYCQFENRKNDRSRRIYHNRCAVRRQISADSL